MRFFSVATTVSSSAIFASARWSELDRFGDRVDVGFRLWALRRGPLWPRRDAAPRAAAGAAGVGDDDDGDDGGDDGDEDAAAGDTAFDAPFDAVPLGLRSGIARSSASGDFLPCPGAAPFGDSGTISSMCRRSRSASTTVSYTHLRAHET